MDMDRYGMSEALQDAYLILGKRLISRDLIQL